MEVNASRIRVIEPKREGAVVLFCQSVIEADTFGVSDVEIAIIRFRRKSGGDSSFVLACTEVFHNDLFDEVKRLFCWRFGHLCVELMRFGSTIPDFE